MPPGTILIQEVRPLRELLWVWAWALRETETKSASNGELEMFPVEEVSVRVDWEREVLDVPRIRRSMLGPPVGEVWGIARLT